MTTLEQLERERQQTLKTIVTSGTDKAKQSEERRVALKKSLASLSALVLDDSTLVVTSVEEAHAAPAGTAVRLELAYRSLRTLPPEACASNLTELSLVGNDLESLPDALSRCCKLRSLALGANRLKALPDLAQVPLLHLGLGCNQVDDHSLPVLLSGLPSKLASFDLGTNGLVSLDPALHQLQVLRALRHLTLAGNPGCARRGYRRAVLSTPVGERLALLDGVPSSDTSADEAPEPEEAPTEGEAPAEAPPPAAAKPGKGKKGADAAAEEAAAAAAAAKAALGPSVTLRFALTSLGGLPKRKQPSGDEAAEEAELPAEMVTVEFELLGQAFATAPAAWADPLELGASFDLTLPLCLELRTALMVHGVTFRVMLQPKPPADAGAEGGAEAAAEGGAVPAEAEPPAEAELVGAIGSKWGPILDGVATCTQQCTATVTPMAAARKPGRKPKKPKPPFTLSLGVTCTILP